MKYDRLYTKTLRRLLERLGFCPEGFTYLNGDQIVYIHPEREPEDKRLKKIIIPRNVPVLPAPMVKKIITQVKAHNFAEKEIEDCCKKISKD